MIGARHECAQCKLRSSRMCIYIYTTSKERHGYGIYVIIYVCVCIYIINVYIYIHTHLIDLLHSAEKVTLLQVNYSHHDHAQSTQNIVT